MLCNAELVGGSGVTMTNPDLQKRCGLAANITRFVRAELRRDEVIMLPTRGCDQNNRLYA